MQDVLMIKLIIV